MSNSSLTYPNRTASTDSDIIFIENHFYSLSSGNGNSSSNDDNFWQLNGNGMADATAMIKRRIKNTWNNAKYNNGVSRWILKRCSSFDQDQPVWLLGKMYSWECDNLIRNSTRTDTRAFDDAYDAFLMDFNSRIWFTYRKDFVKLNGCRLKSDCGWGCMLRCGQMLLAQGIVCHILGRDWTLSDGRTDDRTRKLHRQIVEWFLDCPKQPFSLHRLVELGVQYGKRGGDWYGPASTAWVLRDALVNFRSWPIYNHASLENLEIFVAADGTLYLDELYDILHPKRESLESTPDGLFVLPKSLLLIIPLRLGAEKFNPLYVYHLKTVLSLKSCIGMLGGRPKHSMYFVGWQGDSLIYLDPHYCQDSIEIQNLDDFSLQTFHCNWPRKIQFSEIDPSCAIGFYLRTGTNLADFFAELVDIVDHGESNNGSLKFPLFNVMKRRDKLDDVRGNLTNERIVSLSDFGGENLNSSAARKNEYVFL